MQTQQTEKLDFEGRKIRGYAIISKGDSPESLGKNVYRIASQSGNGHYVITLHKTNAECNCPDYKARKIECKHIHAIKFWLTLKKRIEKREYIEIEEPIIKNICAYCSSLKVYKFGKVEGTDKQRYKCKECKKTFVADKDFRKFKGNAKIVTAVIDLYFKGVSLRKIQDHMKQFYEIEITHVTIYYWIKRFTKLMNAYTEGLKPQVSGLWHIDEQAIKSKGKETWCWNVLDSETRFLIANNITRGRSIPEAREIMKKAKEVRKDANAIITDGLWSYEKAIRREIPSAEHIRLESIRKKPNNNKVERYHNTFRERDKIIRGFKSNKTAQDWSDAFRLYYNFIRPHTTFNGLTPSQVAGINLNLPTNRWIGLLKLSLQNREVATEI